MSQYFVRDSGRSRGYSVRGEVARNLNCSLRILEKLAGDKHSYVRAGVAENPNSSLQILEKLASDKGYFDVKECETWCLMYGMQISESNRRYFVCEEVERNRRSSLQIVEKAASNLKRLKQGKRKKQ
jgi:3-methyladenine DNA glycosylase AlkD